MPTIEYDLSMAGIHQLAASRDGSVLAAAEFRSNVHLWNIDALAHVRTIETTSDGGGGRLAVSPDGNLIAVGAYQRYGVAAYRSSDGSELWRRKDLKKVQQVGFSHDGHRLFCCFDRSACQWLDALSGSSVETLRGVRNLWASQLRPLYLRQRANDYLLADDKSNLAVIPKASFAALSVAFSRSAVCISESAGPVRLFNLDSGRMLWRHDPPDRTHFLDVAYVSSIDQFVDVSWPFWHGGPYVLCRFNSNSGEVCPVVEAPMSYQSVFCKDGSQLVTASGIVIDVDSGRLKATLAFPQLPPKKPQG